VEVPLGDGVEVGPSGYEVGYRLRLQLLLSLRCAWSTVPPSPLICPEVPSKGSVTFFRGSSFRF
jgi:hypothetical protein